MSEAFVVFPSLINGNKTVICVYKLHPAKCYGNSGAFPNQFTFKTVSRINH